MSVITGAPVTKKALARQAEFVEDVEWMAETGEHLEGAATRLGIQVSTLRTKLARADRRDLEAALSRNAKNGSLSVRRAHLSEGYRWTA